MPLRYPKDWKFAPPSEILEISKYAVSSFCKILTDIAEESKDEQDVIETFKRCFGMAMTSSSLGWAREDLQRAMDDRSPHSVKFIDSLWSAIETAKAKELSTPSTQYLNEMFSEYEIPFIIENDIDLRRIETVTAAYDPKGGPSLPQVFGYEIADVIGVGGFGVVHRATRKTSVGQFEYALKFLDPSSFVDKDKALARFRREVRAIQSLQHRAIVPCVDADVDARGRPYLVMQLIEGANIRNATEGVAPSIIIAMMVEVVSGLGHAHARNVLHRDLKPNNILIRTSDTQPIILDFGTAFILDDQDTAALTTTAIGTSGYIPPEVIADHSIRSALQDIYACAVITYELIARRLPNFQQYTPLAHKYSELDILDQVLIRALGPANIRYSSASDLEGALRHALRNLELRGE